MPARVPVVREQTVQSQALPGVRQQIDTPAAAFGGMKAEAMMGIGKQIGAIGADIAEADVKRRREYNALRTLDIATKYEREVMTAFYEPQNGYLTRKGGLALGMTGDVNKNLEAMQKRYMEEAKDNPAVQQLLRTKMGDITNNALSLAQRHEFSEYQTYKGDTLSARSALNAESAFLNWNDDQEFQGKLAENGRLLNDKGRIEGWDTARLNKERLDMESGMAFGRAKAALMADETPQNIVRVNSWMEARREGGKLNMADSFAWDGLMDAALPKAEAAVAFEELKDYGGVEGMEVAMLFHGPQVGQESGGQQTGGPGSVAGPNEPTTSPKGAIGYAQVMPGTGPEAAALAGVAWDEQKFKYDKEYNAKIGLAYMQAQKDKYGSNTLALMAYNAGPGAVDDFMNGTNQTGKNPRGIKLGDPRKGETDIGSFVARFPFKETRDYVRIINARAGGGSIQMTAQSVQAKAVELEAKRPGAGRALLAMYNDQIKVLDEATKAERTAFLDRVLPKVQEANGDYTVLPAEDIAEATRLGVMDKVVEWKGVTDQAVYSRLKLMTSEEIAKVDLNEPNIRLALSQADYQELVGKQEKALGADAESIVQDRIIKSGKMYLAAAGINPTPKADDKGANQKLLAFTQAAEREVVAWKQENGGKNPSDDDLKKIIDNLLLEGSLSRPREKDGWFGSKKGDQVSRSGRAYEQKPGEVFTITPPSEDIIDALQAYATNQIGLSQIANEDPTWIETTPTEYLGSTGSDPVKQNTALNENGLIRLYTKLRESGLTDDEILFYGER